MDQIERRYLLEHGVRSEPDGARRITGLAAPTGVITDIGGMFLETIKPRAFERALRQRQSVTCLLGHDPTKILGRSDNGTLNLRESVSGLNFTCDVAKTTDGDNLLALLKRRDLTSCSFAFSVPEGGENWRFIADPKTGQRRHLRELTDLDLHDVAVVANPAYPGTSVSVDQSSLALASMAAAAGRSASMPTELRSAILSAARSTLDPGERELRTEALAALLALE